MDYIYIKLSSSLMKLTHEAKFLCIGPPISPTCLNVYFSQTTVIISWISPDTSTHCIVSYITKTNTSDSIFTTTNTSVSIPLAGFSSNTTYCSSVAAVDTANRTGTYSDEICFFFEVQVHWD